MQTQSCSMILDRWKGLPKNKYLLSLLQRDQESSHPRELLQSSWGNEFGACAGDNLRGFFGLQLLEAFPRPASHHQCQQNDSVCVHQQSLDSTWMDVDPRVRFSPATSHQLVLQLSHLLHHLHQV